MQCFIMVNVIAGVLVLGLVGGIMGFDEGGQKQDIVFLGAFY